MREMEVEVEEERRRRDGERGRLNLFYVWTYCASYQWPDLSNVCLDRSVQYNIGHIWPIGQISPIEAINYNLGGGVVEMSQQCLVMEKIISYASLTGSSPDIFREYKTPLLSGLREGEIRN